MSQSMEIGRHAALSGALEALRSYETLTRRALEEAIACGIHHRRVRWTDTELIEVEEIIRRTTELLGASRNDHPDLFGGGTV